MPGVFAAGDVRANSVKRVASAVGEGAMAIQLVHSYLDAHEPATPRRGDPMTEPSRATDKPERLGAGSTADAEELRTLFLFEELNDDQLAWLAERGRIVEYPEGATIHAEGAPASCFMVLLSGTLAMYKRVQGGELELFRTDYYGAYTGAFDAYVPDRGVPKVYLSTGRAMTASRLFEIPAADFGRAVWKWFPMAAHLLEGRQPRGRRQQHRRAARAPGGARLGDRRPDPRAEQPGGGRPAGHRHVAGRVGQHAWRDRQGDPQRPHRQPARGARRPVGWQRSSTAGTHRSCRRWRRPTAKTSWPRGSRTTTSRAAGRSHLPWSQRAWTWGGSSSWPTSAAAAPRLGPGLSVRALESDGLLDEITEAAGRISALLASAKQYTQMDRAPLQTFDVHEGLDATLTMLGHKLGDGIQVVRDYDRSLPHISAFPGELNQVWTNLIDNAVDAMGGDGTLTVRTRPTSTIAW